MSGFTPYSGQGPNESGSSSTPAGSGDGAGQFAGAQGGYPPQSPQPVAPQQPSSPLGAQNGGQWVQPGVPSGYYQTPPQQPQGVPPYQAPPAAAPLGGPAYYQQSYGQQDYGTGGYPQGVVYQDPYGYQQPQAGYQGPYQPNPYQQQYGFTPAPKKSKAPLFIGIGVVVVALIIAVVVIATRPKDIEIEPPPDPTQTANTTNSIPPSVTPTETVSSTNTVSESVFWGELTEGDCFQYSDVLGDSVMINVIDCSVPHDAEAYYVMADAWTGPTYPGDSVFSSLAEFSCPMFFSTYVMIGPDSSTLAWDYIYPSSDAWDTGTNALVCFARADSPTLTDSIKGAMI